MPVDKGAVRQGIVPLGNAQELAETIRLAADRDRRQAMGQKGRDAVLARYNWSIDFQRVADTIEHYAQGK